MPADPTKRPSIPRREFLKRSMLATGALGATAVVPSQAGVQQTAQPPHSTRRPRRASEAGRRRYNAEYSGQNLDRVAFPLGGIGAGMICLEGTGALSHFSLRNKPEVFNEPCVFAAISVKGKRRVARVLEGPVPGWKLFGSPGTGNGSGGASLVCPALPTRSSKLGFRLPLST